MYATPANCYFINPELPLSALLVNHPVKPIMGPDLRVPNMPNMTNMPTMPNMPLLVQIRDDNLNYFGNSTPSPSLSSGEESNGSNNNRQKSTSPRILDIHPQYANSSTGSINPHLMQDEDLAELFRGTSQQMELVWHGAFEMLTAALMNRFTLEPAGFGEVTPRELWTDMKEDAKVRFRCRYCDKGWTSMKGKVVFYFKFDYNTGSGEILFHLFGQKCRKCMPETYEHAMWYPQEVIRVLKLLTYKIGYMVYHLPKPKVLRIRRGGSPKEKHEKDMCQACQQGVCSSAN